MPSKKRNVYTIVEIKNPPRIRFNNTIPMKYPG